MYSASISPTCSQPPLIEPKRTRFPLVNTPTPGQKRRYTVGLIEWMK